MLEKSRVTTIISISIPVLLILLIVNFINEIILTVFQGSSLILPLFLCPIGFILAIFSYKVDKNNGAKIGVVLNVLVFLVPFILLIRGTI